MTGIMIQAALLVIVILVVRKIFGEKLHAYVRYGLWALVALRLCIPVNVIDSPLSMIHGIDTVTQMFAGSQEFYSAGGVAGQGQLANHGENGILENRLSRNESSESEAWQITDSYENGMEGDMAGQASDDYGNSAIEGQDAGNDDRAAVGQQINGGRNLLANRQVWDDYLNAASRIFYAIWAAGSLLVGGFFATMHLCFCRRLGKTRKILRIGLSDRSTHKKSRTAVFSESSRLSSHGWLHSLLYGRLEQMEIYRVSWLESPCLVGFWHPAIYVGTQIKPGSDRFRYVVTHEQVHYLHRDHLWALLRAVLVTVYWFHPFVWVAAAASARDGEIACDYGTVKRLGEGERLAYGEMLLQLSRNHTGKRMYSYGTMLQSGKSEIRERIVRLAEPNRIKISSGVMAALLMVIMAGCAFTGGTAEKGESLSDGRAIAELENIPDGGEALESGNESGSGDLSENAGEDSNIDALSDGTVEDGTGKGMDETITETRKLKAQPAQIFDETPLGVDGTTLDYAGKLGVGKENIIIFHDYFGLVVYDLTNQKIIRSLDLRSIGCDMTQGDDTCQTAVSADGGTVWLHPMSKPYMYRYEVEANLLYQEPLVKTFQLDLESEELFDRYLVLEEPAESIGWHSNYLYEEYKDETGTYTTYIYLDIPGEASQSFVNLQCVWDDMVYSLSDHDEDAQKEENQETEIKAAEFPYNYEGGVEDVALIYDVPCVYSRISDTFGERVNPISKEVRRHEGIDFAGEAGALIKAAADGIVYEEGFSTQYGNYVVLLHANGDMTYYCHCESIAVEKDDHVKRGDTIAAMGSTGMSTGVHLHFAISRDGEFVDPELFFGG